MHVVVVVSPHPSKGLAQRSTQYATPEITFGIVRPVRRAAVRFCRRNATPCALFRVIFLCTGNITLFQPLKRTEVVGCCSPRESLPKCLRLAIKLSKLFFTSFQKGTGLQLCAQAVCYGVLKPVKLIIDFYDEQRCTVVNFMTPIDKTNQNVN